MKVLLLLSTFATIALGEIQDATVCGICVPDGCMDPDYEGFSMEYEFHIQDDCGPRLWDIALDATAIKAIIGDNEEVYKNTNAGKEETAARLVADEEAIAIEQVKINSASDKDAAKRTSYQLLQRRVEAKMKTSKSQQENREKKRGNSGNNDTPALKKERVKESRIKIEKTMLPFNDDFKAKLKRDVSIAMSESNDVYDNECNTIDCCTYDVDNDDENTTTLVGVASTIGAWGVLCEGDNILSRQVREEGQSNYTMSCWNGQDFADSAVHSSGTIYTCGEREILIGSQTTNSLICPTGKFKVSYLCVVCAEGNEKWLEQGCGVNPNADECVQMRASFSAACAETCSP